MPVLASSLVFNLADGQFSSRADLIDAPGSSLGRGAQVAGLGELSLCPILTADSHMIKMTLTSVIFGLIGACYDALNNLIWTCSSDYIDQWCNPGNQAFHHVCHRLGVSHVIKEPKGRLTNPLKALARPSRSSQVMRTSAKLVLSQRKPWTPAR